MDKFYNETLHKLEASIKELEIDTDSENQRIETVIQLIIESLSDLKAFVLKKGFKNTAEEIHFFKVQKPVIYTMGVQT